MKLQVKNAACGYGSNTILKDISFKVSTGDMICLLGPNGVGKTTLFKTILGFLNLKGGEIILNEKTMSKLSSKEIAKSIAYVPQAHIPPFPYKVLDVVIMGRSVHISSFSSPKKRDIEISIEALKVLDIEYLKDKAYTEISGGERQLVLIARAIAQQSEILIMDEPTANLDFGNEIKVLNYIKKLNKKHKAVIMTTHNPNHCFMCATKVIALGKNNFFKEGSPKEIITEENLYSLYNVKAEILEGSMSDGDLFKTAIACGAFSNL